jgi:histidine kinase
VIVDAGGHWPECEVMSVHGPQPILSKMGPNMLKRIQNISKSLLFRLTLSVGLVLLVSICTWAYFNIEYQKNNTLENMVAEVDRLSNTIKLGTHYAMMLNSRDDINEIIKNIGKQEEIENIRIYNKLGQISFSNISQEKGETTDIEAEACFICHKTEPPLEELQLAERTRIFKSPKGARLMGIISPIYNEPGCSSGCHVHAEDKKVLGALDVVLCLEKTDKEIVSYERRIIVLAILSFVSTSTIIGVFLVFFLNRPIKRMITWTRHIGQGNYDFEMDIEWDHEIGQLAHAIKRMGNKIREKQEALNKQRDEYQQLFEQVPCYITVQDKNLKLLRYNREYTQHFHPHHGDHCYEVYKGRTEPCEVCPVMRTFEDGQPHNSEETGTTRHGKVSHWLVQTSPIKDTQGEITAVMEMCLDITQLKTLEEQFRKSEEKYRVIFNNIPNPVFVLDKKNFKILDCNDNAIAVYGFSKWEMLKTSFLDLFEDSEHSRYSRELRASNILNQVKQVTEDGRIIFVNIRVSPLEYIGRDALLVTTSDITKRLMAEQQLIQASKMATLGEMATGIAHELNQPLTVIKTASNFLQRKVNRSEEIKEEILMTMTEEIDSHVNRASKIINHLREFGRKSEVRKEKIQVNDALTKSLEIFIQQLKIRGIEVVVQMEENLPMILADSNRLEQVFVNLLINARDAVEERAEKQKDFSKRIYVNTGAKEKKVQIEIKDTGAGIPKNVYEKIFEPFFTTKEVGKGTGLGLSISYGIVQDYEGTIKVKTRENEGSSFIIEFPAAEEV